MPAEPISHLPTTAEILSKAWDIFPSVILLTDPSGFIEYVNPAFETVTGYSASQAIGNTPRMLKSGAQNPALYASLWQTIRDGGTWRGRIRNRHQDGSLAWAFTTIAPLFDDAGTIRHFLAIYENVTELRQTKADLRQQNQRNREILHAAMDGYCLLNASGGILEVNETYCRITGYSEDELLAMQISDLEALETSEQTAAHLQQIASTGSARFETRQRHKHGTLIEMEVSAHHCPANGVYVAFLRDITERKQAHAAILTNQARFRRVIDVSPVAMAGNDAKGNVTFLNPAFVNQYGYTLEDIPTVDVWWPKGYPDPQYRQTVVDAWLTRLQAMEQTGSPFEPLEVTIRCKDGSVRIALASASRLSGSLDGDHVVVLIDITERTRIETALRESEARFRSYIDHAPLGVFISDETGRYVQVNPASSRITGYPEAELLSMRIADLTPAEDWELAAAHFDRVSQSGQTTIECAFHRKNGDLGYWRIDAVKLSETRFLGIAIDITDHRLAVEELKKFRKAVEHSANTIVITDFAGRIEYVNPAFANSTGYTAEEAIGLNPKVLKSGGQSPGFYQELWATISAGNTWRGQFHNKRKDGSLYWESATISPIFNAAGELVHFVAVKEDITDRKALEGTLFEALKRAEAANLAKSEFLAVMSHELRTPLNGVIGFAELLASTRLDPEQSEWAQTIKNSGEHLLQIVNDILDFSSIERGHLPLDNAPVPIAELIDSASLPLRQRADAKNLLLVIETAAGVPAAIEGDALRLRQILLNLLGNAIKFTAAGSVNLRLSCHSEEGRQFLDFAVADTGPGIPAEMIRLLFQPFMQVDTRLQRAFEGTGLGLAISQRLAGAMGGTITVESTVDKGSTFTFRLPLLAPTTARLAKPVSPATAAPRPSATGHPVLVVEDDQVSSLLVDKMLAALGYQAHCVSNGEEAVRAFEFGKFCAILMDMQMPVMDGITATRQIRLLESAIGSHLPIIALTANVMPGHRERCFEAGMDDFLSKPFKKEDLAAKLALFGCAAPGIPG